MKSSDVKRWKGNFWVKLADVCHWVFNFLVRYRASWCLIQISQFWWRSCLEICAVPLIGSYSALNFRAENTTNQINVGYGWTLRAFCRAEDELSAWSDTFIYSDKILLVIFLSRNTKEGVAIKLWDQEMKRCRSLSLGPGPCVVRSVCRGKVS